jgi:hypothetical protein
VYSSTHKLGDDMAELTGSVGRGGRNEPTDVMVIQNLLLKRGFHVGKADGRCGPRTISGIETFQNSFMHRADGRVDPNGKTWQKLNDPAPPAPVASNSSPLTKLVPRPGKDEVNVGLSAVTNQLMLSLLGKPRDIFSQDCQPVTEPRLKRNITTASLGSFKVTGLKFAVDSLQEVFDDISKRRPEVYSTLGTAGMLCCRYQRDSTTTISNHSWGTAIDLTINNLLDKRGDGLVQYGLSLIAPIFNRHSWYWGATFHIEDGMHFEASKALVEVWAKKL